MAQTNTIIQQVNVPIANAQQLSSGLDELNKFSEQMNASEIIEMENSTFDDAFPGLREKWTNDGSVKNSVILKMINTQKIFSSDDNTESENISHEIEIKHENNNKDNVISLEDIQSKLESLEKDIKPLQKVSELITNYIEKGNAESAKEIIDSLIFFNEKINKFIDIYEKNEILIKLGVAGVGLVPPVFMYNTTFKLFSRFNLYPIEELIKKGNINDNQIKKMLMHNKRLIRRFNYISIPLFLTIYLTGLNKINARINSAEMTLDMNKDSSSSNTLQGFFPLIFLRKLDWLKKKIISNKIISIIVLSILISLIYIFHVEILVLFNYLISDNNILYLKYLTLFWLIIWNIINFIELFIYSLKSVNKFNNPKYLPKIILNRLQDMDEDIKLKLAGEIILSYIKMIAFLSIITILYILIIII
jgi:hypothetical protein